jgi:hypothetical protein
MASGRRAFDGDSDLLDMFNRVATAGFPSLREVTPDLPERVYAAVEAAMVIDRDDRISTVLELKSLYLDEEERSQLWSDDLISAAESMGGHGDETREFLRESFRGQVGYQAHTPAPVASGQEARQSAETFYLDSPTVQRSAQTAVLVDFPTICDTGGALPTLEPTASDTPDRRRLAAMVAATLSFGGIGLMVGAWCVWPTSAKPPVETVAVVVPDPLQADGEGRPPVEAEPPSKPVPEPEKTTTRQPETTAPPGPTTSSSGSADAPEPTRTAPPPDEAVPEVAAVQSTPEPAGRTAEPEPSLALNIDSDVSVFLNDRAGWRANVKNLQPGIYTVGAIFDPSHSDDVIQVQKIPVSSTSGLSIKCLGSRRICRIDVT